MKFIVIDSECSCGAAEYIALGHPVINVNGFTGFGDRIAGWIHRLAHITPCAACQRRRRWLNVLFPGIRRDSPIFLAWNAVLASGVQTLPVLWDSETNEVKKL